MYNVGTYILKIVTDNHGRSIYFYKYIDKKALCHWDIKLFMIFTLIIARIFYTNSKLIQLCTKKKKVQSTLCYVIFGFAPLRPIFIIYSLLIFLPLYLSLKVL